MVWQEQLGAEGCRTLGLFFVLAVVLCPQYFQCNDIILSSVKGRYWLGNLQASNQNESSSYSFISGKDVENTRNDKIDTFINTNDLNEPGPAIVDSKNKKDSKYH